MQVKELSALHHCWKNFRFQTKVKGHMTAIKQHKLPKNNSQLLGVLPVNGNPIAVRQRNAKLFR
jgi:hypothetical protein